MVVMSNIFDMETPVSMSYQEKSVYVNLVILLAIFFGYFGYAISVRSPIRLGGALLFLVALQIYRERHPRRNVSTSPCGRARPNHQSTGHTGRLRCAAYIYLEQFRLPAMATDGEFARRFESVDRGADCG